MTQKGDLTSTKDTLFSINSQAGSPKAGENSRKVLGVGGIVGAGNQYVVQIDEREGKIPENTVHQPLECLGRVFEPEWHPQKLKETKWGDDSRLRHVLVRHGYLMITTYQIND